MDGELELECLESGMVCGKEDMAARRSIPDCYLDAFGTPYEHGDVVELLEDGV